MNTTTIQKWGNSLGIRIPKEVAYETHMREGSIISLSVKGETLTLKHSKKPTYTLKSLLSGFDKKTQH
ncbi:MAG: AbrB/MazE/SpoVT family DNA-binding domain-containing protein, partial [bacterium]|nr:AbrB/MazE/SpoVT family DNA-binding domain-containing protein [bacterium]